MKYSLLSLLVSCASSAGGAPGELLLLQQVSRHGARSPKSKYLSNCPLDPFNYQWDSWNSQLSGFGELEAEAIGEVTRQRYGSFIGVYNGSQMTVQSVDSDRVLQTAQIAMSTLFNQGTGPDRGLQGRPTFVPIHTMPEEDDDVFICPAESCDPKNEADYGLWWEATGAQIYEEGKEAIEFLTQFCGKEATSNGKLKDQVDGIGFNMVNGYVTNEYTAEQLFAAQNLSIVLQRGDFASDEARTYMAGDLPEFLVSKMDQAIAEEASDDAQRYMSYFTHRHAGYALAEFFGWQWAQYGIPEGMLQTGTTIWIELRRGAQAGEFDVALLTWAPKCAETEVMSACPVQAIALPGCKRKHGTVCSIDEFRAMVTERIARTGGWRSLCGLEELVV